MDLTATKNEGLGAKPPQGPPFTIFSFSVGWDGGTAGSGYSSGVRYYAAKYSTGFLTCVVLLTLIIFLVLAFSAKIHVRFLVVFALVDRNIYRAITDAADVGVFLAFFIIYADFWCKIDIDIKLPF